MRAHYLDVLVLIVALLGSTIVTFVEFNQSPFNADKSQERDSLVTCWAPAFFTNNHNAYTNRYCAAAWISGKVFRPQDEYGFDESLENQTVQFKDHTEGGYKLRSLLLTQATVALSTFVLLQMVLSVLFHKALPSRLNKEPAIPDIMEKESKKLPVKDSLGDNNTSTSSIVSGSSTVTILYCLVLFAAIVIWFILAGISYGVMKERTVQSCVNCSDVNDPEPVVFICEMKIRQMGNVHMHSVQCVVNPAKQPPKISAEINTAVCYTVACLLLIHLLYTLVVSPLVNNKLGGGGKRKLISDLNLAVSVGAL